MAKSPNFPLPKMCLHKPSDQAYVRLNGKQHYLGPWGSPEAEAAYVRVIGEWITRGKTAYVSAECLTIEDLILRYWEWAKSYYRDPDGNPGQELSSIKCVLREWRKLYGNNELTSFGPLMLKTLQTHLVSLGWKRKSINQQIGRVRRVLRWAVEHELLDASVLHACEAVSPLKKGRCGAKESEPVRPVSLEHVEAIMPHVSPQVADMIQLQLLTGCRAGELVILRPADIDTSEDVWIAVPSRHKTAYRGRQRQLPFGKRAQAIVAPYMDREPETYLFSPMEAEKARRQVQHEERTTPLSCGNRPGTNRKKKPKQQPGEHYTTASYRRAISRACEKAGVPIWSPHQLRHTAATAIRKDFGLDAAQAWLGHANANITQVYAEVDRQKLVDIARKFG